MAGSSQPITVRIARGCAAHPWRAIVGWLLFLALCVGAGSTAGMNKGQFSDFWIGEAGRAESIAADGGLTPPPVERVLITAERGKLDAAAARDAARDVRQRMEDLPAVVSTAGPKAAADGSAVKTSSAPRRSACRSPSSSCSSSSGPSSPPASRSCWRSSPSPERWASTVSPPGSPPTRAVRR
ncbi:hypothetical protein GCM10010346_22620 [Streptomyces chryseus]|uniref:Uncharacterized protein n=1 Tax=Streptomyces chryseus TaxID=68186 RepID=A0ABQ3DLM3_9ACTN|nr:hypothetical protein GCM10010346_22620 [Streptomyces chryseus]